MSLELLDGFDDRSSNATSKWTVTWNFNWSGTTKRTGTYSVTAGNNGGIETYLGPKQTRVIGFAWYVSSVTGTLPICRLKDGAPDTGIQVYLAMGNSGELFVYNIGTGTRVAQSSGGIIAVGQWHYIEWKVTIHDTAGSTEIRVNGQTVASAVNIDTQRTSNAWADIISLGAGLGGPGITYWFDDLYVVNTDGTTNNNFLGDCKVETLLPNAEGDELLWTPSTGSVHYQLVDEVPPNADTDYVYTATAGNRDCYGFQDSALVGNVKGIQLVSTVRKDDATTRIFKPYCRVGITDYDGDQVSVNETYQAFRQIWEVNPATSAAWTTTDLNAAQFGIVCIS